MGNAPFFECRGIRCCEKEIAEIDDGRVMVSVAREDVKKLTLLHGIRAPHPVLQSIMGFALMSIGYFPARHFIGWLRHGGILFAFESYLIAFVFIGLGMIIAATRRGYVLEVELDRGRKRFQFQREPDAAELAEFLKAIESRYGTAVENRAV